MHSNSNLLANRIHCILLKTRFLCVLVLLCPIISTPLFSQENTSYQNDWQYESATVTLSENSEVSDSTTQKVEIYVNEGTLIIGLDKVSSHELVQLDPSERNQNNTLLEPNRVNKVSKAKHFPKPKIQKDKLQFIRSNFVPISFFLKDKNGQDSAINSNYQHQHSTLNFQAKQSFILQNKKEKVFEWYVFSVNSTHDAHETLRGPPSIV